MGAKGSLHDGRHHLAVEVVALAAQDRIVVHARDDDEVTPRAAERP
jgi:hypothetical protein